MPVLHLGIIDTPYTSDTSPALTRAQIRRNRRNAVRAAFGEQEFHGTTGDVAEILEAKYHVYEHFWESHGQEAADAITEAFRDFLNDRLSGSGANAPNYLSAESTIQTAFNKFIDSKEMDGLGYPGIPTGASLKGVNHRLLHPFAKGNPVRPSFKDTGLYEQSFRAWFEE
jgi:hypothetical protein